LLALVGFGLGIDAGMLRVAAAVIMIALGAVLLVPSWQARLAAAGGPIQLDRPSFGGSPRQGSRASRMIGLLLGAVWSPCVGPTSARRRCWRRKDRTAAGHLTMAVFGIGAALPLVLLGLLSAPTLMRVSAPS